MNASADVDLAVDLHRRSFVQPPLQIGGERRRHGGQHAADHDDVGRQRPLVLEAEGAHHEGGPPAEPFVNVHGGQPPPPPLRIEIAADRACRRSGGHRANDRSEQPLCGSDAVARPP